MNTNISCLLLVRDLVLNKLPSTARPTSNLVTVSLIELKMPPITTVPRFDQTWVLTCLRLMANPRRWTAHAVFVDVCPK